MKRCLLVFAASILGLCAATAVAQVQEPSLAAVARQHAAKKAKMVVSDEDFKKGAPKPEQANNSQQTTTAASPVAAANPEAAQVPTTVEAAPVASTNSKPATPAQAEARQKVQELQAQVEFLNRNIKNLQAKLAAMSSRNVAFAPPRFSESTESRSSPRKFRVSDAGRSVGILLTAIVRPDSRITLNPIAASSPSTRENADICAGLRSRVSGSKRFCDSMARSPSACRNLSNKMRSWATC